MSLIYKYFAIFKFFTCLLFFGSAIFLINFIHTLALSKSQTNSAFIIAIKCQN